MERPRRPELLGTTEPDPHLEPIAVFEGNIRMINREPKGALCRLDGIGMNLDRLHLKENLLRKVLRGTIDLGHDVDFALVEISPQVSRCKGGRDELVEKQSGAAAEEK